MVTDMPAAPRLTLASELSPWRIIGGLAISSLCGVAVALAAGEGEVLGSAIFGVLGMCGLVTAFGRKGALIEGDVLTKWWGLFWPLYRKRQPLTACDRTVLVKEVRGAGKSKRTVHVVKLGVADGAAMEIIALGDYYLARRFAEQVANHFFVGLHDDTTGTLVVREAGSLDEPLRSRLFRERPELTAPSPEPPGRLLVCREGDKTRCVLPAEGLSCTTTAVFFLGLLIVASGAAVMFWGPDDSIDVAAQALICGSGFLVFGIAIALSALARHQVLWSRSGITVVSGILKRRKHISADELEELFVVRSDSSSRKEGRIAARSDRTTLWLGVLTEEELDWLYDSICYGLASMSFGYRGGSGLVVGAAVAEDGLDEDSVSMQDGEVATVEAVD